MRKSNRFDVLIVYSEGLASSAMYGSFAKTSPFAPGSSRGNYNSAYAYFLACCAKNKLSAAFTTSKDIVGAGTCSSYWVYGNKKWAKIAEECHSKLIFDKFSPINQSREVKRDLLFSTDEIASFSDQFIFDLFFDKYQTYSFLEKHSIPTVALTGLTRTSIKKTINKLVVLVKNHANKDDFAKEFILKDRYGSGGNNVYKIGPNYVDETYKVLALSPQKYFIMQPLVKFDRGFKYKNRLGSTDIRFIFQNGKIVQTYIRVAPKGDFRCNEHTGGTLKYISRKDIPKKVVKLAQEIGQDLDEANGFFALDFIVSNNGNVYLLEGNTGPGLDWNLASRENEKESKKLIRLIVKRLVKMSKKNLITEPEYLFSP